MAQEQGQRRMCAWSRSGSRVSGQAGQWEHRVAVAQACMQAWHRGTRGWEMPIGKCRLQLACRRMQMGWLSVPRRDAQSCFGSKWT